METQQYILERFGLRATSRSPIEIPNIGRDGFAGLFKELGFKIGAEVGVEQGLYSETICKANPGLQLFCVDPYRAYSGYRDHVSQAKLEGFYEAAKVRLKPYGAIFMRQFSQDAVKGFKDGSLDFVYIDGNHDFQNCTNDIAEWSKKVRIGGIVAGHDYSKYRLPNQIQVVQVVNGWTDANEISPWFLIGTQAKVEGEIRDTSRSWFWVKGAEKRFDKQGKPIKQ